MKMKAPILTALVLIFLAGFVSAQASCVDYGTIDFGTQNSYAVSQDITLKPEIDSFQNLAGLSARVRLLQKNIFDNNYQVVNQRVNLNVLSDNTLPQVTFAGVSRKEPIKFELTIFDTSLSGGEITFTSQSYTVKDALTITPSISPTVENAGQDITVNLAIRDSSGNLITSPLTIIPTIQCGTTSITPTQVSNTRITFRTSQVGYCIVTVSAESNQYVGAEESITFELIQAGISQQITVGGTSYGDLDSGRISTGSKVIKVGIKEGSLPIKLDLINLRMQRPDSGYDTLTFTPSNSEKTEWTTSYNFLSGDRTYSMTGTADNFDTGKQYTFNAVFNTVAEGGGGGGGGGGIPFWVWIIVGVVVIIIIGGIILAVRKK